MYKNGTENSSGILNLENITENSSEILNLENGTEKSPEIKKKTELKILS